jgi:hypothetical protein
MIQKTLESATSGIDMVREGLSLSGEMIAHCASNDQIPLGQRSEARVVLDRLEGEDWQGAGPGRLRKEARAMSEFLIGLGAGGPEDHLGALAKNIAEPLAGGCRRIEREIRRQRAQKVSTA